MDQLLINGKQRSSAVAGDAVGMSGKEELPAQQRCGAHSGGAGGALQVPLQQSPTTALRISQLFIPPRLPFFEGLQNCLGAGREIALG